MAPGAEGTPEGALEAARTKLDSELNRVTTEHANLVNKINSVLTTATFVSPLAGWLFSRKVQGRMDELSENIAEVLKQVRKFLESSTPVFSLIYVGTSWNQQILPELSGMPGIARDAKANALHAWSGNASEAYQEKRWGQRDALEGLSGVVKDTSQWLVDVAALNTHFLVDITTPVIDIVEAIVEAIIEIATVFGVLEAIDTIAAAIADALGAILELAQKATQHAVDSVSKLNEARIILNDNTKFPGGNWPQAVNR
ncbi:hypothetical protein [Plantactinospora sp. B5E13]|uniref:hypothetical protein n=1 Tax=unclassified Plantactinospora TaxID=2631981 RepID=UPI00325D0EB7